MKTKLLFLLLLTMLFTAFNTLPALAQEDSEEDNGFDITNPMSQKSLIETGLGYSRIGDNNVIGFRFKPDLHFGKLGFGLDVPLEFDMSDYKLRTDEFSSGVGALRMIRYLSWGVKKRDPFYIRMGDISDAYLGFGILINNFTNATSFEKRKVGLELDITIAKIVGFEFIYSDLDFTSVNLMGIRPYVKPFGRTGIPIVKTFEIGASYVVDKDNTSITTDSLNIKNNNFIKDNVSAYGFDAGFIIFNRRFMQWRVYAQYANIPKIESELLNTTLNTPNLLTGFSPEQQALMANYGSGSGKSVGSEFRFKFLGNLLRIQAQMERIWYSDYFMPQFFDASYDLNKDAKVLQLASTEEKAGIYGKLYVSVLDKILVGGGILIPDLVSDLNPASIQLNLDASQLFEKIIVTGTYYKAGITDLSDALKIDDRSLANLRVAYKLYPIIVVGVDYKWTFTSLKSGQFEAANYLTPYFGLRMPIGGKNKEKDNEVDDLD